MAIRELEPVRLELVWPRAALASGLPLGDEHPDRFLEALDTGHRRPSFWTHYATVVLTPG